MEAAHRDAFAEVCAVADDKLIKGHGIIKLSDLRNIYDARLDKTPFSNQSYRSEKLKARLTKSENEKLLFVQLGNKGRYQPCIVYTSCIDVGSLVPMTYELSSADTIRDPALQLYSSIISRFKTFEAARWPPTARDPADHEHVLPLDLRKFLSILITGQEKDLNTTKVNR